MAPISYTDIVSYDPTLSYWERRTLYRMSLGFCDGNHVGKQTLGVFPGDERQVEED